MLATSTRPASLHPSFFIDEPVHGAPESQYQPRTSLTQHSQPTPHLRTPCNRPKLTLQTECLPRTFGKSTTGLSVNLAVDSTSPTARNTFRNAYHHHPFHNHNQHVPTSRDPLSSSSSSSSSLSAAPRSTFIFSRHNTCPDIKIPTREDEVPYRFSRGIRSILRNSPYRTGLAETSSSSCLPVPDHGGGSTGTSDGPISRTQLQMPRKKRVAYQTPLNEEISTVTFTARHSDLLEEYQSEEPGDEEEDEKEEDCRSEEAEPEEPEIPDCRQTAPPLLSFDDYGDVEMAPESAHFAATAMPTMAQCAASSSPFSSSQEIPFTRPAPPKTPVAGSHKVQPREWRWTLGPIRNGTVLLNQRNDYDDDDDDDDDGEYDNMISPRCIDDRGSSSEGGDDDYDDNDNYNKENRHDVDGNGNGNGVNAETSDDDNSSSSSSSSSFISFISEDDDDDDRVSNRSSPNSSLAPSPNITPLHTPTSPDFCSSSSSSNEQDKENQTVQPKKRKNVSVVNVPVIAAPPVPPLLRVPTPRMLRPT